MSKNNNWRGLTMDQIKVKQAINQIKIEYEKERLLSLFGKGGSDLAQEADIFTSAYSTANTVAGTVQSVVRSFNAVKNLVGMLRNLRK